MICSNITKLCITGPEIWAVILLQSVISLAICSPG